MRSLDPAKAVQFRSLLMENLRTPGIAWKTDCVSRNNVNQEQKKTQATQFPGHALVDVLSLVISSYLALAAALSLPAFYLDGLACWGTQNIRR